jgi:hypothetical protein
LEFVGWDQTRRRIKDQMTRELSKEGARGTFTLKIDLYAGCPPDWQPDI